MALFLIFLGVGLIIYFFIWLNKSNVGNHSKLPNTSHKSVLKEDEEIIELVENIQFLLVEKGKDSLRSGKSLKEAFDEMAVSLEEIKDLAIKQGGRMTEGNQVITAKAFERAKSHVTLLYAKEKENNSSELATKLGLSSILEEELYSLVMEAVNDCSISEDYMLVQFAAQSIELFADESIDALISRKDQLGLSENDITEIVQEVAEKIRYKIIDEIKNQEI